MFKFVPLLVVMVTFTVVGNIFLKMGAVSGVVTQQGSVSLLSWRAIGHLLNWYVVSGLGFFVLAVGFYIILLRHLPLNLVQSVATAQFVGTILASAIVLSEPIDGVRWVGIFLIAAGIFVVGLSMH